MQEITVDIIPGIFKAATCYASQGDNKRRVKINLTDNGEKYTLTGQELLTLKIGKGNGETITAEMENPGGSQLIALITAEMTNKAGMNTCTIHIKETEHKQFDTAQFYLVIEAKP